MGLSAGKRDREIIVQRAPVVQSESGEESFDWANATVYEVWAEWLPAGTAEAWKAQQRLASYVDGVFRMPDIISPRPTPNDTRIIFDGRTFDCKPYIEIGRGEGIEVPVVASGEGGT